MKGTLEIYEPEVKDARLIRQWRRKPYLLNGQSVEVETTITVIFSLTSCKRASGAPGVKYAS